MPTHSTIEPTEITALAVDALLTAIDGASSIGAATAFKAAITRHGRALAEVEGPAALDTVRERIKAEAPDEAAAQDRARLVSLAWEGIGA